MNLNSDEDYKAALKLVDELFDAKPEFHEIYAQVSAVIVLNLIYQLYTDLSLNQ